MAQGAASRLRLPQLRGSGATPAGRRPRVALHGHHGHEDRSPPRRAHRSPVGGHRSRRGPASRAALCRARRGDRRRRVGRGREVPLGDEVLAALKAERHLRGPLVFCTAEGRMFKKNECKHPLWRACKRAGLRDDRLARPSAHVRFASRDARRGDEGGAGAARSRDDRDDECATRISAPTCPATP